MSKAKTGIIEADGEVLLGEDPNNKGSFWYQHTGGRLIQCTFAKLMYDLPEVSYETPIRIGDKVRIGPFWFKFAGWVGKGGDEIILFKLRGLYIRPGLTANRGTHIAFGDWVSFLILRLAAILYNAAVKNGQ